MRNESKVNLYCSALWGNEKDCGFDMMYVERIWNGIVILLVNDLQFPALGGKN